MFTTGKGSFCASSRMAVEQMRTMAPSQSSSSNCRKLVSVGSALKMKFQCPCSRAYSINPALKGLRPKRIGKPTSAILFWRLFRRDSIAGVSVMMDWRSVEFGGVQ